MRHSLFGLALAAAGAAQAASVTVYTDLASWQAAVSGAVQTQDFSSFAPGDSLAGVAVLPGVTLSSTIGPMQAFGGNRSAIAFGDRSGKAAYEAQYALPYRAVALDITAFESIPGDGSTAVDSGLLSFFFSDGSESSVPLAGGDGSPIFIGVIADHAITSVRWAEAREASGLNEETGLDNLRVAMRGSQPVPLPGSLPLAVLALAALPWVRRRVA